MAKRKSINGSRARHENPIPNASRVGNVVMSSVIGGTKPGTRELPASLEEQLANVFAHIRHDVVLKTAAPSDEPDILEPAHRLPDAELHRPCSSTIHLRNPPENIRCRAQL